MPSVSVIIPLYNYSKYILDCLLSCIHQECDDFEVVVVDDASTDASYELARMAQGWDRRIRVHRLASNCGYSVAKNTAIANAKGEYIRPLDADDMLTPVGITKPLKYLVSHPSCDMVHGIAYKLTAGKSYASAIRKQYKLPFDRRCKIHAQAVMYRKSLHTKFGLYDEHMRSKADKAFWGRLELSGAKIASIDSKLAFYRVHDESMLAMRSRNKEYDKKVTVLYNERIAQIKLDGLTKDNTTWLS